MKKFLDFTHDKIFLSAFGIEALTPIGPLPKKELAIKKLLEKLTLGFKAEKYPYIYLYDSHEIMLKAFILSILFDEALNSGKNQFLFELTGSKATLELAKFVKKINFSSQGISPDQTGRLDLDQLKEKLKPKSCLFSQRLKHKVLGAINDQTVFIKELLQEKEVLYHLDITGALGETIFDLESMDQDFVSFDLESLSIDLKGGLLFSKKPIKPIFIEPSVFSIQILESILKTLEDLHDKASGNMLKMISLKMHLMQGLKTFLDEVDLLITPPIESITTLVVHIKDMHQDALSGQLLSKRIGLDLGGGKELNLQALMGLLGYDEKFCHSCMALTFHEDMTLQDIDEFLAAFKDAYKLLKQGCL